MTNDNVFQSNEIKSGLANVGSGRKKETPANSNNDVVTKSDFLEAIKLIVANNTSITKEAIESNSKSIKELTSANVVSIKIDGKMQNKVRRQQEFISSIRNDFERGTNIVTLSIPRLYAEYQPSFTVCINGCSIKLPADGKPRRVHKSYAAIVLKRLEHLDRKIEAMNESLKDNNYGVVQMV